MVSTNLSIYPHTYLPLLYIYTLYHYTHPYTHPSIVGNAAFYSNALYDSMLSIQLPSDVNSNTNTNTNGTNTTNNTNNSTTTTNNNHTSPFYGLYECLTIQRNTPNTHNTLNTPNSNTNTNTNTNLENEKMRSNAAGAIGNLVRNGLKLCNELIRIDIPQHMINMAIYETSISPQRIALFSLGTMVMYSSCRYVCIFGVYGMCVCE